MKYLTHYFVLLPSVLTLTSALAPVSAAEMAAKSAGASATTFGAAAPTAGDLQREEGYATFMGSKWSFDIDLMLKEAYDSNVYLKDQGPQAHQYSWITSGSPTLSLAYRPGSAFHASLAYSATLTLYHEADQESNLAQRLGLQAGGRIGEATWDFDFSALYVNGTSKPLPTSQPGGSAPGDGGDILERRTQFSPSLSLTSRIPFGKAFVRPLFTFSSMGKFQYPTTTTTNEYTYVGQLEAAFGGDVGYEIFEDTFFLVGYRYGVQGQGNLLAKNIDYSNAYQRALAGLEGDPFDWLTLSWLLGPDIRNLTGNPAPGSSVSFSRLYVEGKIAARVLTTDTVTFTFSQMERTACTEAAILTETDYGLSWKHDFSDKLAATICCKAMHYSFEQPISRVDWVVSPSATLAYKMNKHLRLEACYAFDDGMSQLENASQIEYTRHLGSLTLRYDL